MNFSSERVVATAARASQRCMEPNCGARYALDERLYVCPRCGGLLDVEREAKANEASSLRRVWDERLASFEAREIKSPAPEIGAFFAMRG